MANEEYVLYGIYPNLDRYSWSNNVDPDQTTPKGVLDQTAPTGVVRSGSTLIAILARLFTNIFRQLNGLNNPNEDATPTSNCQPIRSLDQDCSYKFTYWMTNITDPDHLAISVHILNGKQCRTRSVGFFRSQLIWICTVCTDRVYPGSAG